MTAVAAPDCLLLAVEVAVLRALELAAKRSRNTGYRGPRADAVRAIEAWEVYTVRRLATTPAECDRLLHKVWDLLAAVQVGPRVVEAADWYTRQLIISQRPHTPADLRAVLEVACEPAS